MEDLKEKTVDLADHVEDLATTFYRLTVVNVTQKATNIISGAIMLSHCRFAWIICFIICRICTWLVAWEIFQQQGQWIFISSRIFFIDPVFDVFLRKKTIFPVYQGYYCS